MATSRSLPEDELEAIEGKARKLTILDLKKRALAAKQGGDLETAMGCLKKAKKLEAEDASSGENDEEEPPYSSLLPLFWQKVALLCKQAGDLDRAKQALLHSKQLELEPEPDLDDEPLSKASQPPEEPPAPDPEPVEATPVAPAKIAANPPGPSDLPPPSYENLTNLPPPPPPAYDNLLSNNKTTTSSCDNDDNLLANCRVEGASEEEAAMLAELMGGGGGGESRTVSTPRSVPSKRTPSPVADRESAAVENEEVASVASSSSNSPSLPDVAPTMSFTDEELMDEEMMTEFAAGGAQGIPTPEEYAAKVLAYKKLALKFKQEGDIPQATQNLRTAKQLEKVAQALQSVQGGSSVDPQEDPQSWLESLDPEDSALLGELMGGGSGNEVANDDSAMVAAGASTDKLTIADLEEMDDDNDILELVEMMGPDALPTVEEVTAKITEEKQNALRYKQEGNIEMAKKSLLKSKKTKMQAERLARIYRKLEAKQGSTGNDDGDDAGENDTPVSLEALEALVDGSAKPKPVQVIPKPKEPPKDPWLLKPSGEIKAEVIRLKNLKDIKEATRLLQLFKQKLAQEQAEAERDKVSKMIGTIEKRLEVCANQRRLWQYYHWFGKETAVGAAQHQQWTAFEQQCQKAVQLLKTEGSASVTIGPMGTDSNGSAKPAVKKLYQLEDDVTSLVESCTNDTTHAAAVAAASAATTPSSADNATTKLPANALNENALEVVILGLFDMEKNEKLQKHLAKHPKGQKAILEESPDLRIHAKLQLPIQPEDPSKPYLFDLEPSELFPIRAGSKAAFRYGFDPSDKSCRKQVPLPRKDPKHERTLLRRIETKTLQLSVFCLFNQNKRKEAKAAAEAAAEAASKKKSWFFGRGGGETKSSGPEEGTGEGESKDIFLGKVIIDFKPLLARGCISGDFPILVNSKAIGGVLRVCLRTRPVLDPDRFEGIPWVPSDGAPTSLSISSYKQGISFVFPNEMKGDENHSIDSIKRESASSANTQGTD